MVLRARYVVIRYTHIDTDPMARDITRHRRMHLVTRYPRQLHDEVVTATWSSFAYNLVHLGGAELLRKVPRCTPVLVICGFS